MTLKRTSQWIMVLVVWLLSAHASAEEPLVFKTQNDKMSYGLGVDVGETLKHHGVQADVDLMIKGLKDMLSGEKLQFAEADLRAAMIAFQVRLGWKEAKPNRVPADVSYGMGVDVARNLKRHRFKVDVNLVARGLREALSGEKLPISEEELRTAMTAFHVKLRQSRMDTTRLGGEESRREGAFLTQNMGKEGVVTLSTGLQYRILKTGEGKTPNDRDTVEVQYRGTFPDGTEFDSSYKRGQPVTFKVAGAIPGWKEALKMMPVGSRWQLFIPLRLVYQPGGWGLVTGPNATLIFELELLAVK